ncbi:hypothetical protein FA04_14555 [Ensifer adhaerens]|uniref:Uncharacterized protein n=1 Tax=Ensifer adhaerens TaxID=106592 RepID=A0ABY8HCP3_ENSAD|nr:hypothetical protein [Ensifer adhaerens]ANK73733.1 hypothetical protein FA04_14555 [Ensifer adhaerens]KDP70305.1 hypothetical protein FA04_29155 [Ensifer adhaerens]WFP89817.1 hypothetical protein P4B07_14785 [Ensifer adhaerens]
MNIPFPPFEPDKSPFDIASSDNVVNALPVADGWGPMPGLTEITQALSDECRGAVYVRTAAGNYIIIAGTETGLYQLDTTDFSWTDISGPSAPYAVPLQDSWTFTRFGDKLVAHNLTDAIQVFDIEAGGTFADLAGSPPRAKYSWVSGDFLVLGYLEGAAGEKTIRWSGINDIEHWVIGKKGSDVQELPEGDEIMGGFGEQGGFTVIQRNAMQFFPFAPSSGFTFTRQVLNPKQGTLAPRSIVSMGPGLFFYLSEDGFFGGVDRKPIGAERVDRWFLDQIDQTYLADVQGVADPFEKIVWWKYRVANGDYYRLGYDWQLDRWCTTDLQVGEMVALATPAITWDGLDAFYANIDAAIEPFDSRLFSGGRPTFATFTSDNKLAYFTGPNLEATIDTAVVEIDGMARAFVNGARVITDATGFTLADGAYGYHGDSVTWSTANAANRAGLVPFRSDGRLHKFRLVISDGTTWSIASAVNANAQPSGEQ